MQKLLLDYGICQKHLTIYCDNTSVINVSKNPIQHSRIKRIEIWHHFIRELVEDGTLTIKFIHIDDQKVDLFTKLLDSKQFEFLRQNIGVISMDWSPLFLPPSLCICIYFYTLLCLTCFSLFVFSFALFLFFIKKNWKIRKIQKQCVFVYIGTYVLWMAIKTKFSKLCIFCNVDEHLYAQLSKWALCLVFVMSKVKWSLVLNTRITLFDWKD